MILKELSLTNFRNYVSKTFSFSPQTTLIVGPNTAGKTNLLEAIYLLSVGDSLAASSDAELILLDKAWGRVELVAEQKDVVQDDLPDVDLSVAEQPVDKDDQMNFEVFIKREGKTRAQKIFKINGVEISKRDFQGQFKIVIFSPTTLDLVLGSPSGRRSYLDRVLSSIKDTYYQNLQDYKKVVRNRNKLLWMIRENNVSEQRLSYWNTQLFELGGEIHKHRKTLVTRLNNELADLGWGIRLQYTPSRLVKERYKERLSEEVEKATTCFGPHRDDFQFLGLVNDVRKRQSETTGNGKEGINRDLAVFGSRGEQREAVLALCLAELEVVTDFSNQRPLLLLDDIFSELD
ncbi:MAG: DNA replication/repair protein RecF, partial [Patescibacteria group bacterium]